MTSRALEKSLDALGEPGRRHGFRSSFRTWVQDTGAMGQRIGRQVERSYAHSNLLEQRRETMAKWAAFVTGEA